jgi:hypothetical protein
VGGGGGEFKTQKRLQKSRSTSRCQMSKKWTILSAQAGGSDDRIKKETGRQDHIGWHDHRTIPRLFKGPNTKMQRASKHCLGVKTVATNKRQIKITILKDTYLRTSNLLISTSWYLLSYLKDQHWSKFNSVTGLCRLIHCCTLPHIMSLLINYLKLSLLMED